MFIKKIHIKNRTFGIFYTSEYRRSQKVYTFQFYTKRHAKAVGQDSIEKFFTIAVLRYAKRIKVLSHKRTHIKQRIA